MHTFKTFLPKFVKHFTAYLTFLDKSHMISEWILLAQGKRKGKDLESRDLGSILLFTDSDVEQIT